MDQKRVGGAARRKKRAGRHAANDLGIAEKANFGRRCGPRMWATFHLEPRRRRWPIDKQAPLPEKPPREGALGGDAPGACSNFNTSYLTRFASHRITSNSSLFVICPAEPAFDGWAVQNAVLMTCLRSMPSAPLARMGNLRQMMRLDQCWRLDYDAFKFPRNVRAFQLHGQCRWRVEQ